MGRSPITLPPGEEGPQPAPVAPLDAVQAAACCLGLGAPLRIQVVQVLAAYPPGSLCGPMVWQVLSDSGVSCRRQTVAYHLHRLLLDGLVRVDHCAPGEVAYYRLHYPAFVAASRLFVQVGDAQKRERQAHRGKTGRAGRKE